MLAYSWTNIHNLDQVSRLIKRVEPLLARIMTINKERTLSERDVQQPLNVFTLQLSGFEVLVLE